ncbi:N-6 DNA methylase [Nitratireductor mangrovi]|uniref:site-specific DNA-methyltransferase (adenine-specific) n=1 Tax=Nitratireductor mangrovi TaxID=2599600 RepID=A0A5B8L535_9HYPH|nr:DNA methyltransferase [Nitratireductor mangrovi]QDZ03047.2 N-6 DNA methylase [Nitratireductor mangrovi]
MAAGVDLPSSGNGGKRAATRVAHVPLFVAKALDDALAKKALAPADEQVARAERYARNIKSEAFQKQKETAVRNAFFDDILKGVLGYRDFSGDSEYSLVYEHPLRGKAVDAALGRFFPTGEGNRIFAPFEMKGPDTPDLDKIMPGRGISPVQQAWDYAADVPGAKWVLVSNCLEIRLYRFGRGRENYERFDLSRLDEPGQLKRLLLLLEARRFLEGEAEELLRSSDAALKEVTDDLYDEYGQLRGELVAFLKDSADGPKLDHFQAIETAQKLLDRVIFIAFASGNGMLPKTIFQRAVSQKNDFDPQPVWQNVNRVFRWVDKGNPSSNPQNDVWPYNGGLFAEDPVADSVVLPDHLAEQMAGLLEWDYGQEVSVNVLGHIFEQSISDIEKLRGDQPAVSKRKREGVIYTPDHITRFLADHTIGRTLREMFDRLLKEKAGLDGPDEEGEYAWTEEQERSVWTAYLDELRGLTIVDPACGSGAFLIAAFDLLAAEYRRVTQRLDDLEVETDFDVYDEILSRNLYGVDLNVESAEITRLALWLKTARRQHRLAKLDETIRDGNSLIDDPKAEDRPFDWKTAFPDIFANGGFDIVIGNPPYVRMEHLKPVKPWLAKHYKVADERTDLSAYFFEKGVSLLKPGGRLGFISTSSFFRAGYGEKLRLLLSEYTDIEAVIDFGDVQIFEGVTTYPAIVTARKKAGIGVPDAQSGSLSYLNIGDTLPPDLGQTFTEKAAAMPRARLGGRSWQFEDDALAALRAKIVNGRKTLGEVYGAPLYGIKTGLNEAFVIDTPTRDRLVAADPKSAELLKPFLKGENIKRWQVEPEGLWLINTPRGKVDIEAYPAIRDWLLPFRDRLEARATKQEWWELQQAQLAYQPKLAEPKISYPHFQNERMFSLELTGAFSNDKSYFVPSDDQQLLAFLNSRLAWWYLTAISPAVRNGWHEMRVQYVETLPIVSWDERLKALSADASRLAGARLSCELAFTHRFLTDLAAPGSKLSRKLENFHELDFNEFRAEVKRALKAEIPVKERAGWEALHAEASAEVNRLTAGIEAAEREIDRLVYKAFDLTPDEIELLEKSLEGQV